MIIIIIKNKNNNNNNNDSFKFVHILTKLLSMKPSQLIYIREEMNVQAQLLTHAIFY